MANVACRTVISNLRDEIKELKAKHRKELAAKTLLTVQKKHTVYIDGVIAHPFILNYCRENKISPTAFGFLVMISTLHEARLSTIMKYGFKRSPTHQALTYLLEKGLVEKFGTAQVIYTASLKGRKLFSSYKLYYHKCVTKSIYNESERTKYHRWPK